jgi:hypothetical protein
MHPQLLGTSSMVLLRLPEELTGPVNIKIELKHENINFTHAMVHDDVGWASTACDNSSQAPSSYTFQISLNIDRSVKMDLNNSKMFLNTQLSGLMFKLNTEFSEFVKTYFLFCKYELSLVVSKY